MARRVNTKFLTVLTIIIVGLAVLALVGNKFLLRESPEKYINAGNDYIAQKKYEEAAKAFNRAVNLDPRNPKVLVAYGDAVNQLSAADPALIYQARAAWNQALAVDPSNRAALDRLMLHWSDLANISGRAENFTNLKDTADKLFAADSTNSAAEIAGQTAIIRPWLAGIEKDERLITDTIAKLQQLMVKYPDNADLPMFAAQGKLKLAERSYQRDQSGDAQRLVNEAAQIMQDAVKRTPTAAMYFSAAQVDQMQEEVARLPVGVGQKPFTVTAAQWHDALLNDYANARKIAEPTDPLYVFISMAAARASADNPDVAKQILRDLMAKQPNDLQVRLALAETLAGDQHKELAADPKAAADVQAAAEKSRTAAIQKSRGDAIEILDHPFAASSQIGPRAFLTREWQIRTLIMMTNLRLEQYNTAIVAGNKADQDKLLPKINDGLAMIESKDGVDSPRSLRLRGKLLKLNGDTLKAIQTLEKALAALAEKDDTAQSQSDRLERWEIVDLLARSYVEVNQIGSAKRLLTDLVNKFPGYDHGRLLLAQVLIKAGAIDDAKPHVDYLAQRMPDDPDVLLLKLQVLDPQGVNAKPNSNADVQKKQLKETKDTYARLPEDSKQNILHKVTVAMAINQTDDAFRLLAKAQKEMPGDFDVAMMGVRAYRFSGEMEKARDFADVALKANPTDPKLQMLQKQMQDISPAAQLKLAEDELNKNPDPMAKAVGLARIYGRMNRPDDELKQLQAAQRLQPNNTGITVLLFKYYLRQQQFDKAELLIPSLAAADEDRAGGQVFRFQLSMMRGDYQAAELTARKLVQDMGEFGQSWISLGQALQANNKLDEALSKYLTALEKQSDSADAFRGIIVCCYGLNRPVDAKRYIDQARRALPTNPEFKETEIQYELNYGDPEKVIAAREESARKSPDQPNAVLQLGQAYLAAGRARMAKAPDPAHLPAEMFSKAKATFRQGITKWPDEIAFYAYYAETGARSGDVGDSEAVLKQLAERPAWKDKSEPQSLMGEFYAVAHRPADAEAVFRGLAAKDPTNVDVQVRLANLLLSENKVDDALTVLQANIQDPKVSRRRVEILVATDRADEADKAITDALAKSPSNLDLLRLGAGLDMNHGKFDRADQRLARALEIDPKDPTTHYYVGTLRMRQAKTSADYDAAIAELTAGKDSPTMGTEDRFALADCMRQKGNPEGAMHELEGALSSQPGNARIRLALLDAYLGAQPPRWVDADRVIKDAKALPGYVPTADLLEREWQMWTSRGEPSKALAAIQEAHTANPGDVNISRRYVATLLSQQQYQLVNQEVERLLAKDPNLWWAYEKRAQAKRYQGNKEDSIKDFDAAITAAANVHDEAATDEIVRTMADTISPDEAILRFRARAEKDDHWKLMIARLQSTKGDNDAAIKTTEQVLAREDELLPADRDGAWRLGAMLYLITNQPEKATKYYEKLLKGSPDDMVSLNNMACLLAETVQPPRPQEGVQYAEHAYRLTLANGRKDATVMDTYGWLLVLSGRVDEGIDILRAANDMSQMPDIHYHLGEAYIRKQFGDQAQQELDTAMNMVKRKLKEKPQPDQSLLELQGKIEASMARATIIGGKKPTAIAPTGTNVP